MPEDSRDLLGQRVGHIRVVDLIGEGGMGAVYAGYDETLRRKVALKAIRRGFRLSADTKARFLREARILSQIDHPSVCTVFDYIEQQDTGYIVMELIDGASLRDAIEGGLDRRTQLEIAAELLGVLVAVHERGVIHRDLKPENVMVTPGGGLKVLDFGLSRSVDERSRFYSAQTLDFSDDGEAIDVEQHRGSVFLLTRQGLVLGTAGYMSPEQARGEPATAASDMYSYGLMLQELLTGSPPFDEDLDAHELVQRARKGETRPIVGLPPELTQLVERLTSLAPGARPSSRDAFDHLQRIIDAPRRRRRRLLVTAAVIILSLLTTGLAIQTIRASRALERAAEGQRSALLEAETSKEVVEFLIDLFKVADPSEGSARDSTAREILDRGAQQIDTELGDRPELQSRLKRGVGRVYRNIGEYEAARRLLEEAMAAQEAHGGPDNPDLAPTQYELARLLNDLGENDEARVLFERALEIQEAYTPRNVLAIATILNSYGFMVGETGDLGTARELHERARTMLEDADEIDHPLYILSLSNLANNADGRGDLRTARDLYDQVLVTLRGRLHDRHPRMVVHLNNSAITLKSLAEYEAARERATLALSIAEEAYGPGHHHVAMVHTTLATIDQASGNHESAIPHLERSVSIYRAISGHHPGLGPALGNLSIALSEQGDLPRALEILGEARSVFERAYGPVHPVIATCIHLEGTYLFELGDLAAAERRLKKGLELREQLLGPVHPEVADSLIDLATAARERRAYDTAEDLYRRGLEIRETSLGENHPAVADGLEEYVVLLRAMGREGDASAAEARIAEIRSE